MNRPQCGFAALFFIVASLGLAPSTAGTQDAGTAVPLPPPKSALTRIAFGSCADEELPQPIWQAVLAAEPELFLFIGDNVYADQNEGEWFDEARIDNLEIAYAKLDAHADFAPFRRAVPILPIWDDHDYGLNDAGWNLPVEVKQASKRLMLDFFGVPQEAPVRAREGAYQSAMFGPEGRRVQIILLDTRWFRSDLEPTDEHGAPGKERYLPDADPAKAMLGEAQWAWLEEQLSKPADLRLLVSSIQVLADGHGWERWGNLPLERERLFALLRRTRAEGVVVLSGDRHVGGLYRRDGVLDYPLYELTSSSLNRSFAEGWTVPETGPHQIGHLFGPENFGMVTVDWDSRILDLSLEDASGERVRGITLSLEDLQTEAR